MLSLPLVLLSLHALAVYSAPTLNDNDIAVLRRAGGTIHSLTLRREEYHQLKKRDVEICNVPARGDYKCTKKYPSTSTEPGGRPGGSRVVAANPPGFYKDPSGSSSEPEPDSENPSDPDFSYHSDSSQERQDLQDEEEMEKYEKQDAKGNHCDHLVELQTVGAILNQYCTTPGISIARATDIRDYLNNSDKNLYLINGDVNVAKGAATRRALLRLVKPGDRRRLTYKSKFDKPIWIDVVKYLEAKESVARTNAAWIKTASGLTEDVDTKIHEIYEDALAVARAMSR
ncbi:hypothetical protein IW262DRAFT_1297422 [Armillaria fumosa]|nr:hypothetical protein IW262DRAFT_1297422 [Armillaria fumosa]